MDYMDQPKTAAAALPENIIIHKNARLTVLSDRLFRLEFNDAGSFCDRPTQQIWYRNMPPVQYRTAVRNGVLTVKTDKVRLDIDDTPGACSVTVDGVTLPLAPGDLPGTTRTLDCYDGRYYIRDMGTLELESGVCSKNGVAVIDDADSLCLDENMFPDAKSGDLHDFYIFAFGHDYRGALRALYMITGGVPMLPRFAFGNWWSRYHAYSADEYLDLVDRFEENGIPLTVATLDIDWHYTTTLDEDMKITASGKNTADRGTLATPDNRRIGWTGYTWNKKLFPDYRGFLNELHRRGLRVTLNLHPASGVRYFEERYPQMAEAMGVDPSTEHVIPFDAGSPEFMQAYFEILHHPYERDGVDFWWIDWQQGTTSSKAGLDPLWVLNHMHYLDNGRNHRHPLIMSRYAGIGSHRYPIGFSGDTTVSWDTLRLMPFFTASAANCGYTWWGHDIGGHHLGRKDDELYLRFLQFGLFNPINRMHCTDSPLLTKEPWEYKGGVSEIARNTMLLRHKLIPFLYSCNYLTHSSGLPLCEPLYYGLPEAPESYEYKNEYLFGQAIYVAPITDHSVAKGLAKVDVWLPEGEFTDLFTGEKYTVGKGGRRFTAVRPLDSVPAFVKAGAVIPMSGDHGNSCENPTALEVSVYGGSGSFTLYEDSETDERVLRTNFVTDISEDGRQTVTVSCSGDFDLMPEGRSLTLRFPNMLMHHPADSFFGIDRGDVSAVVLKNRIPAEFTMKSYREVTVRIAGFDPSAVYRFEITCAPLSAADEMKRNVFGRLRLCEAPFGIRSSVANALAKYSGDVGRYTAVVHLSDLDEIDKDYLCEVTE